MQCLLASMDGMSSAAFRSVCFEYGADGATTEMIGAAGIARAKHRHRPITESLLKRRPEEGELGAQLLGSDPGIMAEAARRLEALNRFDWIEINMGCPARVAIRSGNGASLLREPEKCGEILRAVCAAVQLPVRLKLRLGWDDECITAPEIARMAEDAGARAVILRGRTRQQMYSGEVNLEQMRRVRAAISVPFYANGAVVRAQDAAAFARATGADGVCIGRAALKSPWIFEDIRALERGGEVVERDANKRIAMLLRFAQRLCEQKPERFAIEEMRKYSRWYLEGLTGADENFQRVKFAQTLDEFRRIHEEYLNGLIRRNDLRLHPELIRTPAFETR